MLVRLSVQTSGASTPQAAREREGNVKWIKVVLALFILSGLSFGFGYQYGKATCGASLNGKVVISIEEWKSLVAEGWECKKVVAPDISGTTNQINLAGPTTKVEPSPAKIKPKPPTTTCGVPATASDQPVTCPPLRANDSNKLYRVGEITIVGEEYYVCEQHSWRPSGEALTPEVPAPIVFKEVYVYPQPERKNQSRTSP